VIQKPFIDGKYYKKPPKMDSTSSTNYKKPKCAKRSSTRLGIELIHNPYSTSNKRTSKGNLAIHCLGRSKSGRKLRAWHQQGSDD